MIMLLGPGFCIGLFYCVNLVLLKDPIYALLEIAIKCLPYLLSPVPRDDTISGLIATIILFIALMYCVKLVLLKDLIYELLQKANIFITF